MKTKPKDDGHLIVDVKRCARCGKNHKGVRFDTFTNGSHGMTHWGLCQSMFEPILLKVVEDAPAKPADVAYFYMVKKIDLAAERARIKKVRYTAAEKKFLRQVCDLVEKHDLNGVSKLFSQMKREGKKDWFEFVGEEIWHLVWDMNTGGYRPPGRAELEKLWVERDKKGLTT
ncbi:MAG: hypothetical protein ACOYB3_01420 [Azonexus sp.]